MRRFWTWPMRYHHGKFEWVPWWEMLRGGLFLPIACVVDTLRCLSNLAESACKWWLGLTQPTIDRIRTELKNKENTQ